VLSSRDWQWLLVRTWSVRFTYIIYYTFDEPPRGYHICINLFLLFLLLLLLLLNGPFLNPHSWPPLPNIPSQWSLSVSQSIVISLLIFAIWSTTAKCLNVLKMYSLVFDTNKPHLTYIQSDSASMLYACICIKKTTRDRIVRMMYLYEWVTPRGVVKYFVRNFHTTHC